jgi:acetate---CoA ligase (ADP-forming)
VDLSRLLHPRSVAVVGATERHGSYAGETLLNLQRAGYPGEVWGVNPGRTSVHGRPCSPSLADCPAPADAVVVAIPARGVPTVVDEAGALGCGGAVVYGAGFGEIAAGAALERELERAALRHGLPLCGPNCNGIVALHERATLWGDALRPFEPGRVALVSQSGNVAVNALNASRGLRFHTVVSCGNSVAVDPAQWVEALSGEDELGAIALYLEGDGDGARLADALAACAERGVGVAVLKVGASVAGAAAAAAHTGALAGDQRIFRALVEEAGAAWAHDVHELLELAKALAVPGARRPSSGLALLTCSGGDSALAADECERVGLPLPPFAASTATRLRELLPEAATVANPLDYTAVIWGDVARLREIVAASAADPGVDRVLVLYDQPVGIEGAPAESWANVRDGILRGAGAGPAPVAVASTLPELLDDDAAARFAAAGVPAIAGLVTGIACIAALGAPPGQPARLREIAAAARRAGGPDGGGRPLSEHDAKELLREAGLPVVAGRLVNGADDAVAALRALGGPVALKLAAPGLRHKTEAGAVVLDVRDEDGVRAAHARLAGLAVDGATVLVERMAPVGAELLVSATTSGVVPSLVVAAGGVWTELLGDAAVIPLPASPERVERGILGLRAAPLLCGGRGRPPLDVAAAARLASAAGELLLERGLELLELNPVLVHERGATVVDAVAEVG